MDPATQLRALPDDLALRIAVEDFYARYVEIADDPQRLEVWPDLFTEDGQYRVLPQENWQQGWPLALVRAESRGMLKDRVSAAQGINTYTPRVMRHLVSNIRCSGGSEGEIETKACFAVFETMIDEPSRVFATGLYRDRLVEETDGVLRLREHIVVLDNDLVPNSIVYPL
ncbi:aromatic-ring-hydroxylating dioxygenase subunit beta [Algihabitans albus]|uniref:aromatic-ring-hydroxylating dioxygenase subunit beta n=1 Tax=Algihabitans albus TaxID=2164067 RepID=UPI000E5C772B|nr:aromatic-ring-hydroxylating dioxygenase subunit beta [Algihabitans albus]